MRRTLKLSLWLPIGVVVLSVIRFGFDPSFSTGFVPMLFSLPAMVFGLVFAWPGGIPLTRALERLHPVSRPATYACAAVLCPLSVGAAPRWPDSTHSVSDVPVRFTPRIHGADARISQFYGLTHPNGSSTSPLRAGTSLSKAAGFFLNISRAEAAPPLARMSAISIRDRTAQSIHRDQPLQLLVPVLDHVDLCPSD